MSSIIGKYRHPLTFYVVATALPWAFWFAAGHVSRLEPVFDGQEVYASLIAFAGLLAPLGAAIFFARRDGVLGDMLGRLFALKQVRPVYIWVACFLMPASILAAMALSLPFGYSPSQFVVTGHFTFSSGVFPVWFLLIVAPIIEELAWHSYGTDALRSRFRLITLCLIFGVFWAIWHMPLAGIKDYYHSHLASEGALYAINFLVSVIPFVILMNWLYYRTERSILVASVFHITAGFFNEIFATHPDSKVIQTGLLLIVSVVVVATNRRLFFAAIPPET